MTRQIEPQVGDYWEFKLPGKRKRVKEVGRIAMRDFLIERGMYPDWKDKIETLPYVHWQRENKGRYTGITVRRLMEFGRRVSTKAERDAHLEAQIKRARQKREAKAALLNPPEKDQK
jgi:hypothetical protein